MLNEKQMREQAESLFDVLPKDARMTMIESLDHQIIEAQKAATLAAWNVTHLRNQLVVARFVRDAKAAGFDETWMGTLRLIVLAYNDSEDGNYAQLVHERAKDELSMDAERMAWQLNGLAMSQSVNASWRYEFSFAAQTIGRVDGTGPRYRATIGGMVKAVSALIRDARMFTLG